MHHDYEAVAARLSMCLRKLSVSDNRNDALHSKDTETIVTLHSKDTETIVFLHSKDTETIVTSMTHAEYVLPVSNTGILG